MFDEKQRLTSLTKEQADQILVDRGALDVPHVFQGDNGSYWGFAHEVRVWLASQHTSGEQREGPTK